MGQKNTLLLVLRYGSASVAALFATTSCMPRAGSGTSRSLPGQAQGGHAAKAAHATACQPIFPDLVARIAGYLPDCRLIHMVRHPLKRSESDWKLRLILRSRWLEKSLSKPFASALHDIVKRANEGLLKPRPGIALRGPGWAASGVGSCWSP